MFWLLLILTNIQYLITENGFIKNYPRFSDFNLTENYMIYSPFSPNCEWLTNRSKSNLDQQKTAGADGQFNFGLEILTFNSQNVFHTRVTQSRFKGRSQFSEHCRVYIYQLYRYIDKIDRRMFCLSTNLNNLLHSFLDLIMQRAL